LNSNKSKRKQSSSDIKSFIEKCGVSNIPSIGRTHSTPTLFYDLVASIKNEIKEGSRRTTQIKSRLFLLFVHRSSNFQYICVFLSIYII